MIIYVVAAKIWYLKNVQLLLGHPVYVNIFAIVVCVLLSCLIRNVYRQCSVKLKELWYIVD